MVATADKPLPWWRLSAPPLFGWPLLVADASLFLAGALWMWPWGVTAALMLPGLAVHAWLSHAAVKARGIRSQEEMPSRGAMGALGGFGGMLGVLLSEAGPAYLAPLIFVGVLTLIVDPLWRVAFRRKDHDERNSGMPDVPGRAA